VDLPPDATRSGATSPGVTPPERLLPTEPTDAMTTIVDASIGGGAIIATATLGAAESLAHAVAPVVRFFFSPPLVPRSFTPQTLVNHLAVRGEQVRQALGGEFDVVSRAVVPAVTDTVVERMDLTDVVLRRVDLGRIVGAVLDRLDLTDLVLERVELDRVVAAVDLDAAAARLDVDAVAARLDVDGVLDRMDLTDVVLRRVDLGRIVVAVLDRIDLTELVLERVDLDRVVAAVDLDAVAAGLDVDAVAARLDLIGIADYIIEGVDLPQIIRSSTGSVATEAVKGARMQGMDADEQLQRVVDKVLLRRRGRATDAPGDVEVGDE
jgi:uncharacterized protein YjbI with pentapeptide repeats